MSGVISSIDVFFITNKGKHGHSDANNITGGWQVISPDENQKGHDLEEGADEVDGLGIGSEKRMAMTEAMDL